MDYSAEYNRKLTTPEKVAELVQDGDLVGYSEHTLYPHTLDEALAKRANELHNVAVRITNPPKLPAVIEACKDRSKVAWFEGHYNVLARRAHSEGLVNYHPGAYHQQGRSHMECSICDVAFIQATPMDKHGYFNVGIAASGLEYMVKSTKRAVVIEENPEIPVCRGINGESIHISEIDYIVKSDKRPILELPDMEPSETEKKIAAMLIDEIPDGACLQLGIGGLPNAIGNMICDSDIKDIGVHTEMLTQAYYNMYKAGKITGKYKNIDKGRMVYTFALGQKSLYDFLDHNPIGAASSSRYTNDPANIALNDNVISINNALEVDLFSQVSSESKGFKHISGTGGQLDYTIGAVNSKNGKAFICLTSTYNDKEGKLHSRIVPTFITGTNVTVPRSLTHYIATEYGIANMKGLTTWGRAEALINLAHPDFREDLIKEAEKMNIWTYTNKKG